MDSGKRSPLLVIFLTVFIDLLGFGIVMPLLPRYAVFLQRAGSSKDTAPPHGEPSEVSPDEGRGPDASAGATGAASRSEVLAQNAVIGMLMASFSAMQFLFAPIWGRLSDRIGRRPVLILGLLSSAVFYGLFSYAIWLRSIALIFVARIGAGIAGATIPTAQAFIADTTSEAERGRGMALIGAAFGIGFTFGPLLGSLWVSNDPNDPPSAAPGIVAAGLSFVAFSLAVAILPESLRPGSRSAGRSWVDWGALKLAARAPTIGSLLLIFFVATIAFANFESTLARLTKDGFKFSDRQNFFVFAYIGFLLMLFQGLFVRRMMPRLGEVVLMIVGTLLMTLGLGGLAVSAWGQSEWTLLGVLPITVLGFSSLTPSVQSLISRRSDPSIQGGILGLAQSAASLARILGPVMGNFLYGFSPLYTLPYLIAALLMGVAFLLSLGLRLESQL